MNESDDWMRLMDEMNEWEEWMRRMNEMRWRNEMNHCDENSNLLLW